MSDYLYGINKKFSKRNAFVFFSRYSSEMLNKVEMIIHYSIVIGIYVKIPSLLPSILGRSTLYERPLQIYMGVGVLLLPLKYPAMQKVRSTNVKI